MGFVEPIVLLTAVHFHFTAALAPIVAAGVARLVRIDSCRGGARAAAFRLAATTILSAPWFSPRGGCSPRPASS